MLEVNLNHLPADGNDRHDKNHFQRELVFGEVCFERFE
jgi:hypothetical protein